jgi:hypothetical protein
MFFLAGLDTKSRFIFLQIPIVLQSALADKIGLAAFSWTSDILFFVTQFLHALHALHAIGSIYDWARAPLKTM